MTITNHGKSDVSSLERRSVVSTVASDSDNLSRRVQSTVDDAADQHVLVLRGSARQNAQRRPNLVHLCLHNLKRKKYP